MKNCLYAKMITKTGTEILNDVLITNKSLQLCNLILFLLNTVLIKDIM